MELDIPHKNVTVKPAEVPYYTVARSQKDTQIINKRKSRKFHNFVLHLGELKVTEWITGYEKRKFHTQELMGTFPLDLPEQSYETVGLWMEIPREARSYCEDKFLHFMGGLHGTEHALLSLVPLFAICDRGDMGGISMVEHVGVKGPAVFLYDGYPGGIGLAERIFGIFENLLERTLKLVEECPCDDGCPSCIHSPKCGSGNYPLNKETVVELMKRFCGNGDFSLPEPVESAKTILKSKPNEPAEKVGIFAKEPTATKTKAETKTGPILVFDLETQLSAEDVGGWGNIEKMRLAVGVTLDIATNKVRIYYEEDAQNLIQALQQAELVIGFNLHRFDYAVLKPYGLEHPFQIRTLDILKHIEEVLGHRLSLDVLCEATLETKKSADGLQSIEWFKQGKLDLVAEYCQNDVKLTRDLYLFGKNNGYILYNHKQHGSTRIPVKW
jgi:DEAD/DEAH box helicase domain-containing protein